MGYKDGSGLRVGSGRVWVCCYSHIAIALAQSNGVVVFWRQEERVDEAFVACRSVGGCFQTLAVDDCVSC